MERKVTQETREEIRQIKENIERIKDVRSEISLNCEDILKAVDIIIRCETEFSKQWRTVESVLNKFIRLITD